MPLFQVLVLAVAQGITEFLPISSTAHLALIPWLFHWNDPGLAFDVALHAGTLLAVLLYFFKTWVDLTWMGLGRNPLFGGISGPSTGHTLELNHNRRLFWYLAAATVPAAAAGWIFHDQVAGSWRHPVVVGSALILVALPMAWGERVGRREKELHAVGLRDSLWIGLAQALALVPGVSRSGITMTAALFLGLRREASARFSFLLSTPIIAGAALKEVLGFRAETIPPEMRFPFALGTVVSGVVGYAVIALFLRFLQFGTFKIFIYYRLIFGIIVLALAFFVRAEIVF